MKRHFSTFALLITITSLIQGSSKTEESLPAEESEIIQDVVMPPHHQNFLHLLAQKVKQNLSAYNLAFAHEDSKKTEPKEEFKHQRAIKAIACSPDGRTFITGSYDKTAQVWDAKTGLHKATFKEHAGALTSVAYSPDSLTALTGSWDTTARIFDIETGEQLQEFKGHSHYITSVAFHPDGNIVLTGSYDATARLWNRATEQCLIVLEGAQAPLLSVGFSQEGDSVVVGAFNSSVIVFDSRKGCMLQHIVFPEPLSALTCSSILNQALVGFDNGELKLLDLISGEVIRKLPSHQRTISSITYTPNGKYIISGSYDKKAHILDSYTGIKLSTLEGHTNAVLSVAATNIGEIVITGSLDKNFMMWDLTTGNQLSLEDLC